jgi:hypothetical protein
VDDLINKIWKVTAWRDAVPASPWVYTSKRLVPGEQIEITEFDIKFKVERSFTKHPNACDVQIYNLPEATRADLETMPLRVQLEAGYNGVSRLMYIGDLRFGMTELNGATHETLLQLGDADRAITHARTNRSYKPGTTYRTVLKDAASSLGMTLPPNLLSDPSLDRQFVAGTVAHGPAREVLTQTLAPFGYHWSVQNGQLRILKDEEVVSGTALPIDEEHGMIGSPHFGSPPRSGKPPHVTVKMLLYPEIVPGDVVKLTSKLKNGIFRVEKVVHTGDSHAAGEWVTEIEIKPY